MWPQYLDSERRNDLPNRLSISGDEPIKEPIKDACKSGARGWQSLNTMNGKENVTTTWSLLPPSQSPEVNSPISGFGKPAEKKRCYLFDLCTGAISFICFALAIASVANESLSWCLGVQNYQLTVLGFLLSLMNLCLANVVPTLLLLLEARFGPSTIQNYDGLLRNKIFSSRLSFTWRVTLTAMLVLPLGLSAAYKQFGGGHSARQVHARNYIGETPRYGLFAPPGILYSANSSIGTALFTNATGAFAAASSLQGTSEPPLPTMPYTYGYNVLSQSSEITAMLDMPHPDYISAIQKALAMGESWQMSASVLGTVAFFNNTKATDEQGYNAFLEQNWSAMDDSSGAYGYISSGDSRGLELMTPVGPNNSFQWVGLPPNRGTLLSDTPEQDNNNVSSFSATAYLYNINRQFCQGTWSITRGGIQLMGGSCSGEAAPAEHQRVLQWSDDLFLPYYYLQSMVELLGAFAETRNQSAWKGPSLATGVAAMLWSRVTTLDSPANRRDPNMLAITNQNDNADQTYQSLGLVYEVIDTTIYIRPTLRKSYWLYAVFAVQPLLIVFTLLSTTMFHTTPLSKDFGMVAILAGVDRDTLAVLDGASLSAHLTSDVRLTISPTHMKHQNTIEYRLELPSTRSGKNGKLDSKVKYY